MVSSIFSMFTPKIREDEAIFDEIIFFKEVGSTIKVACLKMFKEIWGILKVKSNSIRCFARFAIFHVW